MKKVIYCFWTGDNPISENRLRAIESLREKSEVDVVLISNDTLPNYILKDHPLHECYYSLSLNHRSDYLRCYFMNFYGGGYSDIKPASSSWSNSFDILTNSPDKYAIGYKEIGPHGIALVGGELYEKMCSQWERFIGCCAFICKPHTPLTEEWYTSIIEMMDKNCNNLKKYPGDTWGDNYGYPLVWTAVMGNIFHPLCLKYIDYLIQDDNIKCDFSKSYR